MQRLNCGIAGWLAGAVMAGMLSGACGTAALGADQPLRIFRRTAEGTWAPMQVEHEGDAVILRVGGDRPGERRAQFLFNPPAGIDLNDGRAPMLLGVKVDGKALPAVAAQQLETSPEAPKTITFGVADGENPLELGALLVKLDGARVRGDEVRIEIVSDRQVRVDVATGHVGYGKHKAELCVADCAPLANRLLASVSFEVFRFVEFDPDAEGTNLAAATETTMVADSAFPGWESLVALNDGVRYIVGPGTLNDVSWASAEVPMPHWVEVTFPRPASIHEVVIYWATFRGVCHRAREVQVQIKKGDDWVAVEAVRSEGKGHKCLTVLEFEPVEVRRFRVYQPAGAGCEERVDLMWLAEIEVR